MIIMDSREPAKLRDLIDLAAGGDTASQLLTTADYVIFDDDGCSIGIERKTITDLLGSLASGRLEAQTRRLKGQYSAPMLLLEGSYQLLPNMRIKTPRRDTGWHHSALQMRLFGLQRDGIMVLYTPDVRGTADVLRILNSRAAKGCALQAPGSVLQDWPPEEADKLTKGTRPLRKVGTDGVRAPTRTRRPVLSIRDSRFLPPGVSG